MDESLAARIDTACPIRGEFRLRSGQVSGEYFDKYLFESQPALLLEVARAMVPLRPSCDVVAGMELGGVPNRNRFEPADRVANGVRAQAGEGLRHQQDR